MDVQKATLEELKKNRPDLYQAIRHEVCLEELRLTKEDVTSLIEPLTVRLQECMKPYLPKLSAMTYNDIVDMENDLVDEVSELMLSEFDELEYIVKSRKPKRAKSVVEPVLDLLFATLDDLKRYRPDLCDHLYDEFRSDHHAEMLENKDKPKKEDKDDRLVVKKGDAVRWNYTKEEGIVVGFDSAGGGRSFIVELYDGTKVKFENDPKLFRVLDEQNKARLVAKREKYVAKTKEEVAELHRTGRRK